MGRNRDNSQQKDEYFRLFKTMHKPAESADISHIEALSEHIANRNWNLAKQIVDENIHQEGQIRRTISWLGKVVEQKKDRHWQNRLMELAHRLINKVQTSATTALHLQ